MRFVIAALFLALVGCASGPKPSTMSQVSLGMSKGQVVEIMGEPTSVSAAEGVEYLIYRMNPDLSTSLRFHCAGAGMNGITPEVCTQRQDYYFKIVAGEVESYGRVGDFDSTKDSVITVRTE